MCNQKPAARSMTNIIRVKWEILLSTQENSFDLGSSRAGETQTVMCIWQSDLLEDVAYKKIEFEIHANNNK
jgi:hypothetical protein